MITERQLQEGLRTVIREISVTFSSSSVGIMTWRLLDEHEGASPFFIIDCTDDLEWTQAAGREDGTVTIPGWLGVRWRDYEESGLLFRNARQAIVNKFDEAGTAVSLGGLEGVSVRRVFNLTPKSYMPIDPASQDSLPLFIYQLIGFEVELF